MSSSSVHLLCFCLAFLLNSAFQLQHLSLRYESFSKADLAAVSAVSPITSVRYKVLWLTVLLYAITYMDRVCIYAAMPVIAREFSFDKLTQGLIFSAFAWGYSSHQVPSGWLVDSIGPRRMRSGMVLWWSAFTIFTVSAWNTASFIVIRFLFGAGEAKAFPSATRAFSRWLATSERGFAQGVTHSGSRLAGGRGKDRQSEGLREGAGRQSSGFRERRRPTRSPVGRASNCAAPRRCQSAR